MSDEETRRDVDPDRIARVRAGHGANCSSIGSVIDTLFATAVIGSAIFAAVAAALATEPIRVVTPSEPQPRADEPSEAEP
jgi:hypothetical protein